jgi:sulfur carrier protein ThiS
MEDTITVFVNGDSYEITTQCSVADLRERVGRSEGDAHVRGDTHEYVLPNDTVISEYVDTGARVAFVSTSG